MSDKNTSTYVEISMLADRIQDIMNKCRSTYAPAKAHVVEARKDIFVDPKHSVKEMRKAYEIFEDEYILVMDFDKCLSAFSVVDRMDTGGPVVRIEKEFRALIRDGKYRQARDQYRDLRDLRDRRSEDSRLSLRPTDTRIEGDTATLKLANVFSKDITVDSLNIECIDGEIEASPPMVRAIRRGESVSIPIVFKGQKSIYSLSVTVRFQCDLSDYTETLFIKMSKEEAVREVSE